MNAKNYGGERQALRLLDLPYAFWQFSALPLNQILDDPWLDIRISTPIKKVIEFIQAFHANELILTPREVFMMIAETHATLECDPSLDIVETPLILPIHLLIAIFLK